MFSLTPWYDELYTYYYFISRGPVYAAIHWPLPNNHIGYSVLSGFLDFFGNAAIGLRGVSYICALSNLLLLYRIVEKSFRKRWALCCVILYSCMNLVNQLAVQGRGYTLAATCYLTAIYMLQKIGKVGEKEEKETKKDIKYYVFFSVSLTLGLYVLPSSVYWVLPICLFGGLFLLLYEKRKPLVHLIISSVAAAVNTLVLYGAVWLAIGSNLLSKTEGSAWFSQGHFTIIRSAPLAAIKTGIDYMLATPYIQSVERAGYFSRLAGWFGALFDYYYSRAGKVIAIAVIAGVVYAVIQVFKGYGRGEKTKVFLNLYIALTMILMPVFLTIQCTLPYFRVFSYIGIPVAVMICGLLRQILGYIGRKTRKEAFIEKMGIACIAVLAIVLLLSKDYNNEYGQSEYYAKKALSQAELNEEKNICVTDCYQQYLLKFYWDIECESTQIEDADIVVLHRDMADAGYDGFRWEFYHTYDSVPWDYINNEMRRTYENEEYILFERNTLKD